MDLQKTIGQRLSFAFHTKGPITDEIIDAFKSYQPGGITLFRSLNIENAAQVKAFTSALQGLARQLGLPPLIIATDQEGGQLMAFGDGTPLPGNMAIGATRSVELAKKAGEVLGREMAALGINVDYAPCADVNINPMNPVVGVRSFGGAPTMVGEMAAAMIEGIQSQGVAATVKHFPGHGDTTSDTHHGLSMLPHSPERLNSVELVPFRAALKANPKMVMISHLGITALDGENAPPATLSRNVIDGLLRGELGYDGVVITDAMDMRAIRQGEALGEDVLRAAQAGVDVLLMTSDPLDKKRAYDALLNAAQSGGLSNAGLESAQQRIQLLKAWLVENQSTQDLSVIQSAEHQRVADEIAERSLTLVRDDRHLLPLALDKEKRVAVILPIPEDLTPADTSSYIQPMLADSIRAYHSHVDEIRIPYAPSLDQASQVLEQVQGYDLIVLGTINAYSEESQAEFVRRLLATGKEVIVIAMRLPYDLANFPLAPTYICTYSILEPSMRAVAKALFGGLKMTGRLPVGIPGLYPLEQS